MNTETAIHCMKVMTDECVCEECFDYGDTGTDHCQEDAARIAITALEKQIPQKVPDIEHFGRCPECDGEFNSELLNEYNIVFCPWCGQALDWENRHIHDKTII